MREERLYKDYLEDIIEAIDKTSEFIDGITQDQFCQDDRTLFAVIRALEVIGEATKRIPDSVCSKHPEIPWREMAGMRDKLIHFYFGVNFELVWKTVTNRLPTIKPEIIQILEDLKE